MQKIIVSLKKHSHFEELTTNYQLPTTSPLMQIAPNQLQKFGAGGFVHELAAKGRGGGDAVLFLNAAHHHAEVFGFYHHGHALRVQCFLKSF